jgi:hypothetical protein
MALRFLADQCISNNKSPADMPAKTLDEKIMNRPLLICGVLPSQQAEGDSPECNDHKR